MAFRTNKIPVLQEKTASGSVASFNTALAMPLPSCNIAVNAWQEGSGDPSPSNVRPIHGWDKVNLVNSRIVPVNKLIPITATQEGSGIASPSNVRPITAGLTIVRDDDTVLEVYGGTLDAVSGELVVDKKCFPCESYNFYMYPRSGVSGYFFTVDVTDSPYLTPYGINESLAHTMFNMGAVKNPYDTTDNSAVIFKVSDTLTRVRIGFTDIQTQVAFDAIKGDIQLLYQVTNPEVIQLSATELARAKEALGIDTYTIQLGQEVYGAEVDAVNGVAHVTHKYYKPLLREWGRQDANVFYTIVKQELVWNTWKPCICNKARTRRSDESGTNRGICYVNAGGRIIFTTVEGYSSATEMYNAVGDIEFVCPFTTPFDIQLTPTQIETLIGSNNIFCDTGDTSVVYNDLDIAKRGSFREVFKLP